MQSLSLNQAADLCQKAKATLLKAINDGRLSAPMVDGKYEIDPAELHRVFPFLVESTSNENRDLPLNLPDETTVLQTTIKYLEREVNSLTEQLNRERIQADTWRQFATNILPKPTEDDTAKQNQPKAKTRSAWEWVFIGCLFVVTFAALGFVVWARFYSS